MSYPDDSPELPTNPTIRLNGRTYDWSYAGAGYDLVVDVAMGVSGIYCHSCELISFNVNDVKALYCGGCHRYHA